MNSDYNKEAERIRAERVRREEENFWIFIRQLKDPGISYRVKAAEALGNFGDPRAVPYLIDCIKDETDSGVLYVAVSSIGKFKDKSTIIPLISLLECSDKWVRRGAAKALGAIGSRDCVVHIIPMLSDSNPKIRASAIEAIGLMSYWDFIDYIIPLLDDDEADVRIAARNAVKMLGRGDLAD
ncbi:MAG: HEAT repeat domain-containing protein [Methanomicrobium sp.]|nr:HEAT repeat domain-containing protein [Methanomicrobium sp.]